MLSPTKNLSLKPFGQAVVEGHPAQAEEAGPLVSFAGLREMMVSKRTAEVELTEGRETR